MGRVLLDAVIQMGDSDASHGIGDLIQAVVLLHTAGQPLRPFDTFESAAGASGRGFADQADGSPRPGAQGQLAGPEPRAMAAPAPLGVLPRPGPDRWAGTG